MKPKRKMAVAVVAVGALIAATGGWMYAGAQTSAPTQQDARNAAAVISAFIEAVAILQLMTASGTPD